MESTEKNNQGGRPKVEQPKRNRLVSWVDDKDYAVIKESQRKSEKKMSDFIREALLHTQVVVKPRVTPEQSATLIEMNQILRPIAKNISEAAKYSKLGLFWSRRNDLQKSLEALMSISKKYENKLMEK